MAIAVASLGGCSSSGLFDDDADDPEPKHAKIVQRLGPVPFVNPPANVRVLSKKQWLRTIRHLLGTAAEEAARPVAWEGPTGEKFVAAAAVRQSIATIPAVVSIGQAADLAASAAVATRTNTSLPLAAVDTCTTQATVDDPNDRVDCYRRVAQELGDVAFKIGILQVQVDALVAIGQDGEAAPEGTESQFDAGLRQVLATILQAPSLMYSFELGDVNLPTPRALYPHELATRLSLAILGRNPSRDLLQTARTGGLSSPTQVKAVAMGMLAEPEAQEAYWDTIEEWFLIDLFDRQVRESFPQFTPELRSDMKEEARRFAVDHVFGSSPLPFPQILSSQRRFVTSRLVDNVYTQQPITFTPDSEGWGLINFNDYHDQNRSGMITLPAFLTALASDYRTKIVARGKFLWERVLCGSLINLPPQGVGEVPTPPTDVTGVTWRDLMQPHTESQCALGCHNLMDPGGLSLEHFNQIGAYRTRDFNGAGGLINARTFVVHPQTGSNVEILDGLDYGKLMADPAFPNSDQFIENTASCQWTQLHEAMLGEPLQGEPGAIANTQELANLKAAVPGYPQYLLKDFLGEFVSSIYFTQVGAPR